MVRSAVTICLVPEAAAGPFVFHGDCAAACATAARLGFDAVEIFAPDAAAVKALNLPKLLGDNGLSLAALGTGAGFLQRQLTLTSPSAAVRAEAIDFVRAMIDVAAEFETSVIVGSMQGRWTPEVPRDRAISYLGEAMFKLGDAALPLNVKLFYEPLNRYETNLFTTLSDAVTFFSDGFPHPSIKLLADLFHMNIEEYNLPSALREVGSLVGHVHFADSNRHAAGYGHSDFALIASALRVMKYAGYVSAEVLPYPNAEAAAAQSMMMFRRYFPPAGVVMFDLKPAAACRFDQVSLGEVMLRLDPGDGRVRTARSFAVWEGGGEYNVARGLRRCFGLRTALVSAFADNEVGRLLEDLMLQGGVDLSHVRFVPFDGVGRTVRNGLNFTERGFGLRGAVGVSDRGLTAASQLKPGDVDWDHLFGTLGVRWFHTGGIFAALSATTSALVEEALIAAKRHGVVTSYDLNYRPSLWQSIGGPTQAQAVNKRIAKLVDVMLGNEEDFTACLGLEVPGDLRSLDHAAYRRMIESAVATYPNFKAVATTLRTVRSATRNDWGAICWAGGAFHEATHRPDLEVFDRVGGGDSFASGLIYAFLAGKSAAEAVEWGAAHGALAMTTPGDTSMASLDEVRKLVGGGTARVER